MIALRQQFPSSSQMLGIVHTSVLILPFALGARCLFQVHGQRSKWQSSVYQTDLLFIPKLPLHPALPRNWCICKRKLNLIPRLTERATPMRAWSCYRQPGLSYRQWKRHRKPCYDTAGPRYVRTEILVQEPRMLIRLFMRNSPQRLPALKPASIWGSSAY